MAVMSAVVCAVTAGLHRHWLLGPIGPMLTNAALRRGLRPPTAMVYNASAVTSHPIVPLYRRMVQMACVVAAVEPMDSEDKEGEEEDMDNRDSVIQQYFQ
ncbi:hypothetical protein NDU88_005620 [Pleurodeles waltl]|uniref:Uncharacterized protein n=1 Tax=Pleurodeles waltl TaxID=8319 RepID=A0AAV7MB08_PLEWA|nr:hypothetical protein NDU88_005620 [Pleurodeles waltl]